MGKLAEWNPIAGTPKKKTVTRKILLTSTNTHEQIVIHWQSQQVNLRIGIQSQVNHTKTVTRKMLLTINTHEQIGIQSPWVSLRIGIQSQVHKEKNSHKKNIVNYYQSLAGRSLTIY